MMFKNAVMFKFTKDPWEVIKSVDSLTDQLAEDPFNPIGPQETSRSGWVSAIPGDDNRVFDTNDCVFLRLRTDKKILKESAIKREVEEIAKQFEEDHGRTARKNEKAEIRETVILKHLPHALVDSIYTTGYIDLKKNWLVVEASSFKAAEEFASRLRKTLGSLPVRPPALELAPGFVMTGTLDPETGSYLTQSFTLGEECTMVGLDGEKASFKDIDLLSDEVTNHITDTGMMVSTLRLSRDDQIAFTLTDDFRVRKIKFLDQFQEDVLNYEPEDEDIDAGRSYAMATLFLMTGALREVFDKLIDRMGGEEESFDPLEDL